MKEEIRERQRLPHTPREPLVIRRLRQELRLKCLRFYEDDSMLLGLSRRSADSFEASLLLKTRKDPRSSEKPISGNRYEAEKKQMWKESFFGDLHSDNTGFIRKDFERVLIKNLRSYSNIVLTSTRFRLRTPIEIFQLPLICH